MRLAVALCLWASAGAAQTADWDARVAALMDEFEAAVYEENIVPFKMRHEHPAILQASADYLELDVTIYRDRALHGYAKSRAQTELVAFELLHHEARLGQIGAMDWAVVSYRLQLQPNGGPPYDAVCHRLVIFGTPETTHVTTAGYDVLDSIAIGAVPVLATILDQAPANCR